MSFVYDNTSIATKSNLIAVPSGGDPSMYFAATDWSALRTAHLDTRSAILAGKLHGFTSSGSRPTATGASVYLWVNTDGDLVWYDGITDKVLSQFAAGGDLTIDGSPAGDVVDVLGLSHTHNSPLSGIGSSLVFKAANEDTDVLDAVRISGLLAEVAVGDEYGQINIDVLNDVGDMVNVLVADQDGVSCDVFGATDATFSDVVVSTLLTSLGNGVGATSTETLVLENQVPATNGNQRYSGVLGLAGRGWDSGASASRDVRFGLQLRPVQGNPVTGELQFMSSVNGSSYTSRGKADTAGLWTLPAVLVSGTNQSTSGKTWVVDVQTSAYSAGLPGLLEVKGAAHTGITATNENVLALFDFGQTYTWATGGVANQRFFYVKKPSIDAAGASAFSKVATMAIEGAPTRATGTPTFAESWALLIGDVGGASTWGGLKVETSTTSANPARPGALLATTVTPGVGTTADSPVLVFGAAGYESGSGHVQRWTMNATGSTSLAEGTLAINSSADGSSFSTRFELTSEKGRFYNDLQVDGNTTLTGTSTLTGNATLSAKLQHNGSTLGFYGTTAIAIQDLVTTDNQVTNSGSIDVVSDLGLVDYDTDKADIQGNFYQLARAVQILQSLLKNLGLFNTP